MERDHHAIICLSDFVFDMYALVGFRVQVEDWKNLAVIALGASICLNSFKTWISNLNSIIYALEIERHVFLVCITNVGKK